MSSFSILPLISTLLPIWASLGIPFVITLRFNLDFHRFLDFTSDLLTFLLWGRRGNGESADAIFCLWILSLVPQKSLQKSAILLMWVGPCQEFCRTPGYLLCGKNNLDHFLSSKAKQEMESQPSQLMVCSRFDFFVTSSSKVLTEISHSFYGG